VTFRKTAAIIVTAFALVSVAPAVASTQAATATLRVADWSGTATESFDPYGINQQPTWTLHFQSSSCTDAGSGTALGKSCQVSGNFFFHIITQNNRKLCVPFNDLAGNGSAQYQPTGLSRTFSADGVGVLNPYQGQASTFFYEADKEDLGADQIIVMTGHTTGTGLKSCVQSSAKLAGVVQSIAN
jgi:hypothetical protein